MKKLAFLLLACFLFVTFAYAHPPQDIIITYDPVTKIVKAIIKHDTSNPKSHYIKKVDVAINDKEIIEQTISRQDDLNTQTVSYLIPDAKKGDRISVEGYCSISGKLEKEIKI